MDERKVEFRRLPFDLAAYAEALLSKGAKIPYWLEEGLRTNRRG